VKRAAGVSTNGSAIYGWRVEEDGRIVEDEQEQEIMTKIRERTRGRLFAASSADLADWLTKQGYRNRAGRPWHRSGILRILRAMRDREAAAGATS
jgi:hypothetical protein